MTKLGLQVLLFILSFHAATSGLSMQAFRNSFRMAMCTATTCCDDDTILKNFTGLRNEISTKLYGQHLVSTLLPTIIEGHLRTAQPKKALAIALDGTTGTGKNFVAAMIARYLFSVGDMTAKSSCVTWHIASHHFPNGSEIETYKKQLRSLVMAKVSSYPRSLFIFDEMDKMPEGLLDVISPFLDYHSDVDCVDFRKSTFIFLSNAAGDIINELTFLRYADKVERTKIQLEDIENSVRNKVLSGSALWHSGLIEKHLIDFFIPFLPLERTHVADCVRDEFRRRNVSFTNDDVDLLLKQLPFNSRTRFALAGCKLVANRLLLLRSPKQPPPPKEDL